MRWQNTDCRAALLIRNNHCGNQLDQRGLLRPLATSVRSPGAGHGLYQSSVDSIDTETGSAYRSTPTNGSG